MSPAPICLAFATLAALMAASMARAEQVFDEGTVFVEPNILSAADPTALITLTYKGIDAREMYDRRAGWVRRNAFLFEAEYQYGARAEVQVGPEFQTREAAREQAQFYAAEIGRLPAVLRVQMTTIWIHAGDKPFGGGNNSFLIHTDYARAIIRDHGALHEALTHEGVHTSLDDPVAQSPAWRAAQKADGRFISPYAEEHPAREDLAETFLIWMAARYFPQRVAPDLLARAEAGNAARFAVLDSLNLDMSPYRRAP